MSWGTLRRVFELPLMRRMVVVKSIFGFYWARVQEGKPHLCASWNPTIERCGFAGELGTLWNGGEQMTYEEMMQIEEARVVAEQKAWERLHEAIFKELFKKTDKQSTGSGISWSNEHSTVCSSSRFSE